MYSDPAAYDAGSDRRAAALAKQFMGAVNNGGFNAFLTFSWDLDASEVLDALVAIGAAKAAKELGHVLHKLGTPVLRSTEEERWDLLEKHWPSALDEHDALPQEAEDDLTRVLESHVQEHQGFYLGLSEDN
jgi:hypothetical protein